MPKMSEIRHCCTCNRLSSHWFEAYYKKQASICFRQCLQETYNASSKTEKSAVRSLYLDHALSCPPFVPENLSNLVLVDNGAKFPLELSFEVAVGR
jgi:hypothetical protein